MRRPVALVLAVVALGFALATWYWLSTPPEQRFAPYPDQDYVKTATATVEGQAFVAKYPEAQARVERSPAVIVDLGVDRGGHSLHVRFYMDAFEDRVLEAFPYCDGKQQRPDVVAYLETEKCLAP